MPFYRSAVGEANVVDLMLLHSAVLGGEGNGGVIDPRVGLVRDSFVGMALLLDAMAARDAQSVNWPMNSRGTKSIRQKLGLPREKLATSFAALEDRFSDARADRFDGLRLDWPDRWLFIRGSNTEPIVRVVAEAPDAARSKTTL